MIDNQFIHDNFLLNNSRYNKQELLKLAPPETEGRTDEVNIDAAFANFIENWFDDSAFINLQTSGSTGVPKQIKVKKQFMVNSAISTGLFFNLNPGDKVLNCLPMQYVSGKMMLVRALILGLNLDYIESNSHPLKNNNTHYDFVAMVPLQAQNSINELDLVKKLIIGGAKINPKLESQLLTTNTKCYETYGMTETVSHIAVKKLGETFFKLLPDVKITLDNRNCLIIDAPKISDNVIITNDLVEIKSDNEFILFGRYDNIINSGGVKIIPEVLESKLLKHIDRRFFIMGKPDDVLGEKVILVVEGTVKKIQSNVFEDFNKYEKPKEIIFIQKLSETKNGKIIRRI